MTLPEGVRVSPSSADGLGACSPAQIGLHSTADPTCPDSSKVATMTIKTPLIDQELTGSVYLATPNDNPFHSLLAIYLVAKGAGVIVKLAGQRRGRPEDGSAHDDGRQRPAGAVLEPAPRVQGRRARGAPDAAGVRHLHDARGADLVEREDRQHATRASRSTPTATARRARRPGSRPASAPAAEPGRRCVELRSCCASRAATTTRSSARSSVDLPTGALAKIANVTLCPDAAANAGTCRTTRRSAT